MTAISPRTLKNIATLDARAQAAFTQFAQLAAGEAAKHGCEYHMIAGNRSWAEQDALYARGRTAPGSRVTNARGGYSNHNFGIAGDFGVFKGKVYLDESDPRLAERVHRACAAHALDCGLDWGGHWESFQDAPHYEMHTVLSLKQKRARFEQKGSVL
jgi:peptidoglycan L-alanyl-D-glutamate endopeptidase CwlK